VSRSSSVAEDRLALRLKHLPMKMQQIFNRAESDW